MSNCHCNSDIRRDGSGQLGRFLKALNPSNVKIDDRSMEDLLVFAKHYARQIRFYDVPESLIEGDDPKEPITWSEFFRKDMAVIAASLAVTNLDQVKKDFDETNTHLATHPTQDLFTALFTNILGMAARMDRWYNTCLPGYPLRKDLELGIASSLKLAMQRIMAFEKGYPLVDGKLLKVDYSAIHNTTLWGLDADVPADSTIYVGATPADKILHASLFAEEIFLIFFSFMSKLVDNADDYLKYALEKFPAHQPHMALFIAFLEIFRLAQDQINGITGRMLDFYFRDVLHLKERPSQPDRAHIVFELAKDVTEYDLPQGTALLGGKDTSGKDLVYKTETDFVINSAKVKELKTLFIQRKAGIAAADSKVITSFYARPVANSADGKGAKFADASGQWPTLGEGFPAIEKPQNVCEAITVVKTLGKAPDAAQVGFAVASPQLLLQGGKRLLKMSFSGLANLAKYSTATSPSFTLRFSAEKGWLDVAQMNNAALQTTLVDAMNNGVFEDQNVDTPGYFLATEGTNGAIYVYLPMAAAPIVGFDSKIHTGSSYDTVHPVMQVLIRDNVSISEFDYNATTIGLFSMEVQVGSIIPDLNNSFNNIAANFPPILMDGLKKLVLQNDGGVLDPTKPFDPFTAYPSVGKSLYIGSSEVFNKNLDKVAIDIRNTNGASSSSNRFEYRPKVLNQRQWVDLFRNDSNNGPMSGYELTGNIFFYASPTSSDPNEPDIVPYFTSRRPPVEMNVFDGKEIRGFLRLDYDHNDSGDGEPITFETRRNLAPLLEIKEISVNYHSLLPKLEVGIDQLFHVYPFGVAEVNLNTVVSTANNPSSTLANRFAVNVDPTLVNANNHLLPQFTYTGLFDRYKVVANSIPTPGGSGTSIPTDDYLYEAIAKRFPKRADQLILEASGLKENESGQLNQYSAMLQEEGLLFIGLEEANPLDSVSLLFQFADGSAKDEDSDPPQIHWSYLVYNEWRPLKTEHISMDDTFGFQTTGIVMLEVPQDATTQHSIITDGLIWFAASVSEFTDRIPKLLNIVAQAVIARFEDKNNAQSHFDAALPAGSISKLQVAAAAVSKVSQPFASFDGKHKEVGKEFYTHVSERLRHKGRAVTSWDYEHLVLDQFPSIFKVKCIQHLDSNCLCRTPATSTRAIIVDGKDGNVKLRKGVESAMGKDSSGAGTSLDATATCCGSQIAPGHVMIVPIPNLKNRNDSDPLQPKTSRRTLIEIQEYLQKRASAFVHVHARNPVYEQVIVFFRVQFYKGTDKGYLLKKLNDEIVHYLTPWAFDDTDVVFGQKVYASAIINFIEERPYVDFITDFVMDVCLHECCPEPATTGGGGSGAGNDDPATVISALRNCDDMEALFGSADFTGYDVAIPSTSRSILVSAPQHIIIPYEAPDQIAPCAARKMATQASVVTIDDRHMITAKTVDFIPKEATGVASQSSPLPSAEAQVSAAPAPLPKQETPATVKVDASTKSVPEPTASSKESVKAATVSAKATATRKTLKAGLTSKKSTKSGTDKPAK